MKRLKTIFACMLMTVLSIGQMWATPQVVYTLEVATNSGNDASNYAIATDVEISNVTWNVTGNSTLNPWRLGGNKSNCAGVDRAVYSKTAMSDAITKVELGVGDISASGIAVNSLKLVVASDAAYNTVIDEVEEDIAANSTITFEPTSPLTEWSATGGVYFKFVFNLTVSANSGNKFVAFSGATFYKESSDVIVKTLKSIAVSGQTTAYEVGDVFSFDGTCTATYSVTKNDIPQADEQKEVDPTSVSSPDMTSVGSKEVTVTYTDATGSETTKYNITVSAASGDKLTPAGVSNPSSYGEWPNPVSGAVAKYIGYAMGSDAKFQLKSNDNVAGIVSTSTGGLIKKVKVTWESGTQAGRTLNVYGYDKPYAHAAELYGSGAKGTLLGTIVYGTSTEFEYTGDDKYAYVGVRSNSGALYLTDITFVWDPVTSIAVKTAPTTTTYAEGENFDPAGLVITATYESGKTMDIAYDDVQDFTFTPSLTTELTTANTMVSITYGGQSVNQSITVNAQACTLSDLAYAETEVNKLANDAAFTNPLTLTTGQTVAYSGDADAVATVNPTTGQVTIHGAGTVHITATVAEEEVLGTTYCSKSVSYTLTVAPVLTSLEDIFSAATSTATPVNIAFQNWVISAVTSDNKNAYLTDNTYGLVIYTSGGHNFAVGDVLSGTVSASLKLNQGNAQLVGLTSTTEGLSVDDGGTITPRPVSNPATLTGANAGSVITISGLCTSPSSGKYAINGVQLWTTLCSDYTTPAVDKEYTCTGVFVMYNTTKEILPRQASDLVPEDVPTAVITLADVVLEKGQNTTLAATVAPTVAASAEVIYSILDGDSYVSLAGAVLTADEVGTAHIRATVADNLPNYKGATKDITVTVNPVDSRKKAYSPVGGFTEISGSFNSDIAYASYKGDGTANPNVPAGKTTILYYQPASGKASGGYMTLTAVKGCKIDQVKITTANNNATKISYSKDGGALSDAEDVAASSDYLTDASLDAQSVNIYCMGTSSSYRLYVAAVTVYYTGEPATVTGLALGGTYQTEFAVNETFNHTGVVVTATYSDASEEDVTALADFSEPDMSTTGNKTITVSFGEQSITYDIEVVAATLSSIALSGTYPTSFAQGDAFDHIGMVVTATYSDASVADVTADANFSGYDMSGAGIQTVTVAYGGKETTYKITVVPANTDVITVDGINAEGESYADWLDKTFNTSAVYAGNSYAPNTEAIQIRTSQSKEGIVVTTQNKTKVVKSVVVNFATEPTNSRVLQVYGKHSVYTSAADLFDTEKQGTLIGTLAASGTLDCTAADYEFIGLRSSDGAMYLACVMVTWGDATPPTPTEYTVLFTSAHGTEPDPVEAASVTLVELTEAGWTHTGWTADADVEVDDATVTAGTLIANGKTAVLSSDVEFTAVWEEVTPTPVDPDYTTVRTDLTPNAYYTMCLDKAVISVKAGSIWRVLSKAQNGTDIILEEVTTTVAGRPYIIYATETTFEVEYSGDAVLAPVNDEDNNGLVGSFTQELIAQSPNNYIIYNNALYYVNSLAYVGANRAYLDMTGVPAYDNDEPQVGNVQGRRRVVMNVYNGNQMPTGIEGVEVSEAPRKVMIDGQLFILRDKKMYDASGRLVK